jgi:rubrerythrin
MIACSSSGSSPSVPNDAGKEAGFPNAIDATLDSFVPDASDAGEADADASSSSILDSGHLDVAKPYVDSGWNNNGGCFEGSYGIEAGPEAGPDADVCAYIYACGLEGSGLASSGCQVLWVTGDDELVSTLGGTTCWIPQGAGCNDDALAPYNDAGGVIVYCNPCPTSGRRPAGLCEPRPLDLSGVGAYLARMAFEEDASVVAFERMERELRALGAPQTLRSAARRAARDEVRHARTMRRLARARGGHVERACVADVPDRSAAVVAVENAIEGCVRETYGALVATWQSRRARDSKVRRAFARIAEDETSHAALSWAVARWIEARLCPEDRARVARARLAAVRSLRASVAIDPAAELVTALGLPTARDAGGLLDAMRHELA